MERQLQLQANKKYNLSKWKYAELRDTINTSCDLELLEVKFIHIYFTRHGNIELFLIKLKVKVRGIPKY